MAQLAGWRFPDSQASGGFRMIGATLGPAVVGAAVLIALLKAIGIFK